MKHILISFLLTLLTTSISAQNNCDIYYNEGLKYMNVMTEASQKAAISLFNKAMACYDSATKKQLCRTQISKCNQNIKELSKPGLQSRPPTSPNPRTRDNENMATPSIPKPSGALLIKCNPADCNITVQRYGYSQDGEIKQMGSPKTIHGSNSLTNLIIGEYVISFQKDGYLPQSKIVRVTPKDTVECSVVLKRNK